MPAGPFTDEGLLGIASEFVVSRTVRDSAALLDVVEGASVGDPFVIAPPARSYLDELARSPGRLRIGVLQDCFAGPRTDPAIVAALDATVRSLTDLGHEVETADISIGVDWDEFFFALSHFFFSGVTVWLEALAQLSGRPIDDTTLEPATLAYYEAGRKIDARALQRAFAIRNVVARSVGSWFATNDILLSPTMPTFPQPVGFFKPSEGPIDGYAYLRWLFDYTPFTPVFNMTGLPAMSMPIAHDPVRDLPIGMHFVGRFGDEGRMFQLAGQLEEALPWASRRPRCFVDVA